MSSAIQGLEPALLWKYFAELSAIPRCSKHEEMAVAYVMGVAKKLNLEARKDTFGNVVVRTNATAGHEKAPGVVLQSHLDMVCEKNSDKAHDFSKDPIALKRNGNVISADGTTLGADNGIGVATSLALMEDTSLRHGPLEFLFTIDEETGLTGAANLQPDFLRSRILINLDSEDDGSLCVGCAGGGDTVGTLPAFFEPMPAKHVPVRLSLTGLRGGHSGVEIHVGRANAIKLLARAIHSLSGTRARLCSFDGGNKRNAIPREAFAVLAVPAGSIGAFKAQAAALDQVFKSEWEVLDKGVTLSVTEPGGRKPPVLKKSVQTRLVNLLYSLPHGVLAMSPAIKGLVETSTNLAVISTTKKSVVVETSQRSSVASEKLDAMQILTSHFLLAGAKISHGDGYPGWKPNLNSPILKLAKETYLALFGKEPLVEAIHAGLECGLIGEKYPGMDMVSMGPTVKMVHSPEENIQIDSVKRFWEFLVRVLEKV
jgi:dipeptidase D